MGAVNIFLLVTGVYLHLWNFENRTLADLGDFCMIHDHISCLYALPVGTGCIVKCVSFAVGREPTVVGKPYKPMLDVIKSR